MKTSTIERRLRDADPARGLDLGGVSDASRELRDAIAGAAAGEADGFDTTEIVLPSEAAHGARLRRRHALVAAAAGVVLIGGVAGALTVVLDRGSDSAPRVATAGSPSTAPSPTTVPPTTVPPATGLVPPTTVPTGTTVPGPAPGGGAPAGGPTSPGPDQQCQDRNRPYPGWDLRASLLRQVPNGFGGLYGSSTGTLVVAYVPGHQDAVARAKAAFDAGVCADSPVIDYRAVATPLVRLEQLMDRMRNGVDLELDAQGVDVNAYGVDDSINKLRVGLAEVTPANEQAVLVALGAVPDEVWFEQADVVAPS